MFDALRNFLPKTSSITAIPNHDEARCESCELLLRLVIASYTVCNAESSNKFSMPVIAM